MNHTIQLTLTSAEWAGLQARCAQFGMSRERILLQFIRDFTGAPFNGGSNERGLAEGWADLGLRWLGNPPKTEKAMNRRDRLMEKAYREIERVEAEWRSRPPVVTGGSLPQGSEGDRKVAGDDGDSEVAASIQQPAEAVSSEPSHSGTAMSYSVSRFLGVPEIRRQLVGRTVQDVRPMLAGSGRLVGVELGLENGRKIEICHALPETLVSLIEEKTAQPTDAQPQSA